MNATTSDRLAHLYDVLTEGWLAGHAVRLPNIYQEPALGAVAHATDDCLHIAGPGFSVAYQEAPEADFVEDRLLIAWQGDNALQHWLETIEATYYPADLLTGNRPIVSPPTAWRAFTVEDGATQSDLEREILARTVQAWGYRTTAIPDDGDNLPRTYYFESVSDLVLFRCLV